jgi:hypothetical protein
MPQHLTPNMIKALEALDNVDRTKHEDQVLTNGEVAQHLVIRFRKGSYMGQPKTFGKGSAAAAICRALERRGLARWALTVRFGTTVTGWQITAAGCAKLSEVRSTLSA